MKRREFIGLIGGAAAWPLAAGAQKAPIHIGVLISGAATSAVSASRINSLKQGLNESGLIEGRDYILDTRYAAGNSQRFPEFAQELAQAGVGILLAGTVASVRAAQKITPPLPVVMLGTNDPVGTGLVASLARPGGSTTGMATLNEDLTPKLLEFQREVIPNAKTIAALFNPSNSSNPIFVNHLRTAAGAIGIAVLPVELKSPEMLEAAFATISARHPDVLHIISDSGTLDLSDRIASMALSQNLPSLTTVPDYPEFGGLLAYGTSSQQRYFRSGYFVRKILDGANPGDLPVEQPTRYELAINLNTAKALGLMIPATLLARADKVIE